MEHPTGNRRSCQGVSRQRPYYQIPSTPLRVHRHQENSVPTCITEDHWGGGFFFEYGPAEEISTVRSKSGIATRDVELMVTLTRNRFNEVPKVITCGGQNICVVVRGAMPSFVFAVPRVTLRNCARKKSGTAVSTIDNGAAHGRSA